MKKGSTTIPMTGVAAEHHAPGSLDALKSNLPYDQFVAQLLNPDIARRPRWLPYRRQLAR